jgi:hypothetical protein
LAFIASHFPEDNQWQLTPSPFNESAFLSQAFHLPIFYKYDLTLVSPSASTLSTSATSSFVVRFTGPSDLRYREKKPAYSLLLLGPIIAKIFIKGFQQIYRQKVKKRLQSYLVNRKTWSGKSKLHSHKANTN